MRKQALHDHYASGPEDLYPNVKDKILTIDLPHQLGAKFNSLPEFLFSLASLKRAMLVMRQLTCVSSRSSFVLSAMRGITAHLVGSFVS